MVAAGVAITSSTRTAMSKPKKATHKRRPTEQEIDDALYAAAYPDDESGDNLGPKLPKRKRGKKPKGRGDNDAGGNSVLDALDWHTVEVGDEEIFGLQQSGFCMLQELHGYEVSGLAMQF